MTWLSWQDDGRKHGTGIQWTQIPGYRGETWNPTVGCTRVSAGCDHCYAFALHDQRHVVNRDAAGAMSPQPSAGTLTPYGARKAGHALPMPPQYDLPFSQVQLLPDRLDRPLHWRKPRAVFVDSMADLFHEDVPDEFIFAVWRTIARSPQHLFIVLTKRPRRMREWFAKLADVGPADAPPAMWRNGKHSGWGTDEQAQAVLESGRSQMFEAMVDSWGEPPEGAARPAYDWQEGERWWPPKLPNLWLGVSAERQQEADERIPLLLQTPAAVRFVSYEPALRRIDFSIYLASGYDEPPHDDIVDWLIVGGESGTGARPFDLSWARSTVQQGRAAGVPVFVKQLGARPHVADGPSLYCGPEHFLDLKHGHGGDWSEWPAELRVREFPIRVGTA